MEENLFRWKHFKSDFILLCVRWYIKYPLSYRNIKDMMLERGMLVDHTTIMRWVFQYAPILNKRLRNYLKPTNDSWRMDETYLKIKGVDHYLYRAVDSEGETIDFWLSKNRDKKAAHKFLKKALKSPHNQQPRVITTDKYRATEVAIAEGINFGVLSCRVHHRMVQYLNNIVEQDHRFIKKIIKPMLGLKNFNSACSTIAGIEAMRMIKKGQAGTSNVTEEIELINGLFCVA